MASPLRRSRVAFAMVALVGALGGAMGMMAGWALGIGLALLAPRHLRDATGDVLQPELSARWALRLRG